MKVVALISCMFQENADIIARSNIQTDVVVVNQCDKESFEQFVFRDTLGNQHNAKFICTKERGLSRSRNMAIANAEEADICLICDDDEYLVDGYENIILEAYQKATDDTAVISFAFHRKDKLMASKELNMGIKRICKTSSVEVTFKRQIVLDNKIVFDVKMGSGSGNGAGEENKFLMDIRRAGYKLKYVPEYIGELLSYDSQWFKGWDEQYFRNRGWSSRRIFGFFLGYLFSIYQIIHHYGRYSKDISFFRSFISVNKGFFEKR